MSDVVIKVEELSKQYRLGSVGTGTLTHDVNRLWHKIRGKEDPYLKVGEENDRTSKGTSEYVWALKDVNFEVKRGEVLGVIGGNGAGKSTLLKILSRTTSPTTGSLRIKGKVASLLEVGTGFHPELSGRENIFLNGAILGMSRREIHQKFDEIVDFAGVERYIDTPVKRYSSGMYVRLAFGVAAHLEPEILIVDEVLAVGDADFQKKCLGKMNDISKSQGRTIIFVSHNMGAVSSLCSVGMVLQKGKTTFFGEKFTAIGLYKSSRKKQRLSADLLQLDSAQNYGARSTSRLVSIELRDENDNLCSTFYKGSKIKVRIFFELYQDVSNLELGYAFNNATEGILGGATNCWDGFDRSFNKGSHTVESVIPSLSLLPGQYSVGLWVKQENEGIDNEVVDAIEFEVISLNQDEHFIEFDKYNHIGIHHQSSWSLI